MPVKLIVDSGTDFSKEEADRLGIILIPMEVRFEDEVYLDGVNLAPKMFFEKLINANKLPKTSQVIPYRFESEIEPLVNQGYEVVIVTISGKLSGTYNNALQAAKLYPGKVYVVDSMTVSAAERLLAEYAYRLIQEGKNALEIFEALNKKRHKLHVLALLSTLKYLKKGGRISPIVAIGGELLSIKPIVTTVDGEVRLLGKARGFKSGKQLLTKLLKNYGEIDLDMPFGVIFSGFSRQPLDDYLAENQGIFNKNDQEIPVYEMGSTIGTHIGPGTIGVAFFEKE